MKLRTLVVLVAVLTAVCPMAPGKVLALNDNVEVSLGYGFGDLNVSGFSFDSNSLSFNLFYTHYFAGLETDDSPYGAREFLQHPSWIGAGLMVSEFEAEDGFTGIEIGSDRLAAAGTYYTRGSEYSTGIGLLYLYDEDEVTVKNFGVTASRETEEQSFAVVLTQYLARNGRVRLSFAYQDGESGGTSYDGYELTVGGSALIERIWLDVYYRTGEEDWSWGYDDEDLMGYGFEIGAYPTQKAGLFFSYTGQEIDDGSSKLESTEFAFSGDVYLNERTHIKGTLAFREEDIGSLDEIEETALIVQAGFYF